MPDAKDIDPSVWPVFLERLTRFVDARVPSGGRDDVVGEILLKLIQHRQKLAATRNPFAWITRVAANAVADHHRRRASEQRAMVAYASDASLSDDLGEKQSDITSASDDLAGCVLPFIERLPRPYQDALTLVDIEGLPQVVNGMIAVSVFVFIRGWEEFVFVLVLSTQQTKWTMSLYTFFVVEDNTLGVDYGLVSAVAVFYILPSFVLYTLAQKYLMQMTVSGVKG